MKAPGTSTQIPPVWAPEPAGADSCCPRLPVPRGSSPSGTAGTCGAHQGSGRRALLTWRSLGPGWGIRRVRASPRARCAPAAPPPAGPSAGRRASASWRTGLAGAPGSVSSWRRLLRARSSQWLPAFPRPASAPPSSAAALFPPLGRTGQSWFLRSGVVPLVSFQQPQLGRGRAQVRPSPRSTPGAEGSRMPTQRRADAARVQSPALCAPAAGGHPGRGPSASPPRPGRSRLLGRPASLGTRLPPRPVRPASTFPLPSANPAAAWGR